MLFFLCFQKQFHFFVTDIEIHEIVQGCEIQRGKDDQLSITNRDPTIGEIPQAIQHLSYSSQNSNDKDPSSKYELISINKEMLSQQPVSSHGNILIIAEQQQQQLHHSVNTPVQPAQKVIQKDTMTLHHKRKHTGAYLFSYSL